MSQVRKYVTRTEFDPVKEAVSSLSTQVQILTTRVEVLAQDMHRLTNQVADIAEDLSQVRTEVNGLRVEMRTGFAELAKVIADNHVTLLSAVMKLSPR